MKAVVVFDGKPIVTDDTENQETTSNTTPSKLQAQLQKMQKGVQQMDQMIGKASRSTIEANITKYETALADLVKQGPLSEQDQIALEELTAALEALRPKVAEKGDTLTPEIRQKMRANMDKMMAQLDKTIAQITNL